MAQKEQRGVYIRRTKIAKKTSIKGDAKVFFKVWKEVCSCRIKNVFSLEELE
jgi:hypothetical protein